MSRVRGEMAAKNWRLQARVCYNNHMITKAIIPVAGWGTRRLPITKVLEKSIFNQRKNKGR